MVYFSEIYEKTEKKIKPENERKMKRKSSPRGGA